MGPRTRPRSAGRGEGTREPRRPALRLLFPGQRGYLHRPSRTWRRQKSQSERAQNAAAESGDGARPRGRKRRRRWLQAAAWRAQRAARRRRAGGSCARLVLSRRPGASPGPHRAAAGAHGSVRGRWREQRAAPGRSLRAAWTAAPPRPAPTRAPSPRAPPHPHHGASAAARAEYGRPEPLSRGPPRRPGAAWGSAGRAREDAPAGAAPAGGLGGGARLRRQGLLHRSHEPHHQLDRSAGQVGPRGARTPRVPAWAPSCPGDHQPGLGRGCKGTL